MITSKFSRVYLFIALTAGNNLYTEQDYHEILNVASDAPYTDIKNACRKMKVTSHPDKNNGNAEIYQQVNDACAYFEQREVEETLPLRIEALHTDRNCTACALDGANFDDQDLEHVDLSRSSLKNTSFQSSNCEGSLFNGAELVSANFTATQLREASFIDAQIKSRTIDQEEPVDPTVFKEVNAQGAKFCASYLFGTHFEDSLFTSSDFNKADISYCWFARGNLCKTSFREATIAYTSFGGGIIVASLLDIFQHREKFLTVLKGASFNEARIENSSFTYCDLARASFKGTQLSECSFLLSDLTLANFSKARAEKTNFEKSRLINTHFSHADLRGSNFRDAIIDNIKVKGTNLDGSDFRGATIKNVDFTESSMQNVNLEGAIIEGNVIFKENAKKDKAPSAKTKKSKDNADKASGDKNEKTSKEKTKRTKKHKTAEPAS